MTELTEYEQKRCSRKDVQNIIGMVMKSPLGPGKKFNVDGEVDFNTVKNCNVDVASRIIMVAADQAARGDLKAAEFLFKYGGYTPAVETQVEVTLPTIVDDMEPLERNVTAEVIIDDSDKLNDKEFVAKAIEDAKKKDDVITDTEDVITCDITKWGV